MMRQSTKLATTNKPSGHKKKMQAGKKFKPSAKQRKAVAEFAVAGISHEKIADALDIDADTLEKHFRKELDDSLSLVIKKVAATLVQQAYMGNLGAICFFLKCRGGQGWKENNSITLDGKVEIIKRVVGVDEKEV